MKRGFTLIELLVVIAIIGILASVVLIAFPGATRKANDSRIISAISQARTVMTYIYGNDGNYDNLPGACVSGATYYSDMNPLCLEVAAKAPKKCAVGGGGTGTSQCTIQLVENTAGDAGCIYSKLNAKADYWYCADSTGMAGTITGTDPGGLGHCDGTTAVCPSFDQ